LPSWRPLVAQWFKDTTSLDFPEMETRDSELVTMEGNVIRIAML